MKTKIIILALCVLFFTGLIFGRPVFSSIASYFSYNKYEGLIEVSSPVGKYIASGCHIIGGATTTDSTFVVIRSKDEGLDYKKNEIVFIVDNLEPFEISWANDHELMIRYTPGPIYIQKFKWNDVHVTYSKLK